MVFPQSACVILCWICKYFFSFSFFFSFTFFEFIPNSKESKSISSQLPKHQSTLFLQLPLKLQFTFDNSLVEEINESLERFQNLKSTFKMTVLEWKKFGGSFIKSNKMSPDAFIQMALQLAVYKLYGRIFATYESASTKRFLCGRTETGRSVSVASKEWVRGMTNSALTKQEKIQLLKVACDHHSNFMKNAGFFKIALLKLDFY